MGNGETQIRDTPVEQIAVSPDEAVEHLFGQASKPVERREIKRGEFMVMLANQKELNIDICLGAEGAYREAQARIVKADWIKEKAENLERNDYNVRYYIDTNGNLSLEGLPKEGAGFKVRAESNREEVN